MLSTDTNSTRTIVESALLSVLRHEGMEHAHFKDPEEARALLGDVLISSNKQWKQDTLSLLDKVWLAESKERPVTRANILPVQNKVDGTSISVWRGDITTLQVDAIVNAANDQGLGCFQPSHKCIDNVIHRQAGPRLRLACQDAMNSRGSLLTAGSEPILTDAFYLPSSKVIHVTGPQVHDKSTVTQEQSDQLAKAYSRSLDMAAKHGLRSIAFPCISTGLFGFPSHLAVDVAMSTVHDWLTNHPGQIDLVVFDVFAWCDEALYLSKLNKHFEAANNREQSVTEHLPELVSPRDQSLRLAKTWIDEADAVLIVAGAGMSVKPGEMVYTNPTDFAKHYPWFTRWGYKTNYECMGLAGDMRVPQTAKWALFAKHIDNMRWTFTPNEGYDTLRDLVGHKDYFVLTSNVDACFERSGFDPERIYTPQGEWTYVQCMGPCAADSVYESRPYLDKILPHISDDGEIPKHLVPKCPRCGSEMFGNVRGGGWFLHHEKYQQQNVALQNWMQEKIDNKSAKIAVIEIGAGFNTPTVTRLPAEAFARELGDRGALIRINPSDPEIPQDLTHAISVPEGWQALLDMNEKQSIEDSHQMQDIELETRKQQLVDDLFEPVGRTAHVARYFGGFNWRGFLGNLQR